MRLQMIGCSHRTANISIREKLAFTGEQISDALRRFRQKFPEAEAVLLSTCNRVEFYTAAEQDAAAPNPQEAIEFLASYHGLLPREITTDLHRYADEQVVRHLFTVAASLDSMVVGEAQILSQVKQAYEMAQTGESAGPLIHSCFQAAIRVAKLIASQTAIHEKRVSVPSVAVGDFVSRFFDRLDDKRVLLIGAGEMGQETLRYLVEAGAKQVIVMNRHVDRAEQLAAQLGGVVAAWDSLIDQLSEVDLVVSTTGAAQPIVTSEMYRGVSRRRHQRPLFVLDLAVPRDFAAELAEFSSIYLYSLDDLQAACEVNRKSREAEWPKAERIINAETARFMTDLQHRETVPTIRRLREQADLAKDQELSRLWNRLEKVSQSDQREIARSFDRLVNKLLHPPLESLRDEAARQGNTAGLLEALKRLFQLHD